MDFKKLQLWAAVCAIGSAIVSASAYLIAPTVRASFIPAQEITEVVADGMWQKPLWDDRDPNQGQLGGRVNVRWDVVVEYPKRMRLGDTARIVATARISAIDFVNVRKVPDGEAKQSSNPALTSQEVMLPTISEEKIRREVENAFENEAVTLRLSIAGADTSPDSSTAVLLNAPLIWTVHPKTAGRHEGSLYGQVKRNALLQETAIERPKPKLIDIDVDEPLLSTKNVLAGGIAIAGTLGSVAGMLTFIYARLAERRKRKEEQEQKEKDREWPAIRP